MKYKCTSSLSTPGAYGQKKNFFLFRPNLFLPCFFFFGPTDYNKKGRTQLSFFPFFLLFCPRFVFFYFLLPPTSFFFFILFFFSPYFFFYFISSYLIYYHCFILYLLFILLLFYFLLLNFSPSTSHIQLF